MAAQIGSLTVDLTLKSAQFISDLSKSSKVVAANTSAMRKSFDAVALSVKGMGVGLGGFASARVLRSISRIAEESIRLAATWDGPLQASAKNFLKQTEQFNNAFQFGLAQGFLEEINGKLGNSETSLRAINEVGSKVGSILGQGFAFASQNLGPLADGLGKVVQALEYISTKTPGQAVDDILGRNQGIAQMQAMVGFDAIGEKLDTGTSAWDAYKNSVEATNKAIEDTSKVINVAFPDVEKLQREMFESSIQLKQQWLGVADTVGQALGTMWKENKAIASVQAVINTAQAITEALKLPFPLNWAQVGAVTALGAAQIATINSAQPGSAKKPSTSGAAAGAAKTGGSGGGGGRSSPSQNIHVVLNGQGGFSRDQVRGLMDQMRGLMADGNTMTIS